MIDYQIWSLGIGERGMIYLDHEWLARHLLKGNDVSGCLGITSASTLSSESVMMQAISMMWSLSMSSPVIWRETPTQDYIIIIIKTT